MEDRPPSPVLGTLGRHPGWGAPALHKGVPYVVVPAQELVELTEDQMEVEPSQLPELCGAVQDSLPLGPGEGGGGAIESTTFKLSMPASCI